MSKNSTLIYFVNGTGIEKGSDLSTLIDKYINNFLDGKPENGKSPSDRIIDNILNYSRSYDAKKTKSAGYVEMNLN